MRITRDHSANSTFDNSILLKTDGDITRVVESFNNAVQHITWSATPASSNPDIDIEYSSIKEERAEKRKLWQK
jgi:hypothetical protein